jgi:hypothetical protein
MPSIFAGRVSADKLRETALCRKRFRNGLVALNRMNKEKRAS